MSYKESTNFVPTPSMKSIKKVCSDLGINSVITQQQMLFFVISFGWSYGFANIFLKYFHVGILFSPKIIAIYVAVLE